MSIKMNPLFSVWSPDEAAECLGDLGDDLCRRLWSLVKKYPDKERSEVPDDFSDYALENWWGELTEAEQSTLNDAAEAISHVLS